ncbi:hypothetical protein [Streptomyces sp. NPDC048277]|uniref:hypothetical protein n=1 Tax=Streptomyces sp. NPDC048277 TaxID=3155027 RepID=UPI0033EAADE8
MNEWLGRFARHVDWQMAKSGMNLEDQQRFATLEESLKVERQQLDGTDVAAFRRAMEASQREADRYVEALRSALADSLGPR